MEKSTAKRTILANGIIFLSETIPHVRSVSLGIWVKTGSRYESPEISGISHFIEHLLFKGTENRSAREIAYEIDSLGGQMDAFTGREYTCYYARVMDEHLPKALQLLADLVTRPSLTSNDMEVERQVILEEIRMIEDTPEDYVHDMFTHLIWQGHALGQSILGTQETVKNLSNQDIARHFKANYHSGNIIIAAAGNFDPKILQEQIEEKFKLPGSIERAAKSITAPEFQPHFIIKNKDLEQVHLCLGSKGIAYSDEQRYAAYILNTVLGGGMSSRLFQKIREERGLAYAVYSYFTSYLDTGMFAIYAGTAPSSLHEVLDLIMAELKTIKNNPLDDDELNKSKEQLRGALMLGLESTTNRMTSLAKHEIYFGYHITMDEIINGIELVTTEQVQSLARNLFSSEFLSLSLLGAVENDFLNKNLLQC